MAIKDVKCYYYQMQAQYLEMKADLADFEQALQDGFITEEQLVAAKEEVVKIKNNYDRLSYIMYLLDMPNRKSKKDAYVRQYKPILDELVKLGADIDSIKKENSDALVHFKAALKALNKKDES